MSIKYRGLNGSTTIINNKNLKLSSSSSLSVFTPFFITGFTDGEGCFYLGLSSTKVQAVFEINLHIEDRAILEDIKTVLGVGYVYKMGCSKIPSKLY